jgi:pimeloyl-ACP methyl ester carboxylesterase
LRYAARRLHRPRRDRRRRDQGPAIVTALQADGYYVLRDAVPPVDSVATRVAVLATQVDTFITANKLDRVHIIAHSMGGLDSRYLISSLHYASKITSLTALETPHRGSPLADIALGITRSITASQADAILALTDVLGPDVDSAEVQMASAQRGLRRLTPNFRHRGGCVTARNVRKHTVGRRKDRPPHAGGGRGSYWIDGRAFRGYAGSSQANSAWVGHVRVRKVAGSAASPSAVSRVAAGDPHADPTDGRVPSVSTLTLAAPSADPAPANSSRSSTAGRLQRNAAYLTGCRPTQAGRLQPAPAKRRLFVLAANAACWP